jgi:hypothetical protein
MRQKKKKTQVIGASPSDWPWFERFDQMFIEMFGGTAKINGIPNEIDQVVQNLHSHSEVQSFEVRDDDVTQGTQRTVSSSTASSHFWSRK